MRKKIRHEYIFDISQLGLSSPGSYLGSGEEEGDGELRRGKRQSVETEVGDSV